MLADQWHQMLLDDYVAALQARRVIGQAVPVSYSVLPASGGGTPTGTVTVSDRHLQTSGFLFLKVSPFLIFNNQTQVLQW